MVTIKADSLQQQYPEVSEGVGKLKNKQIFLDIDPNMKPIAQPYRRMPFNPRRKILDKTTGLLDLGIIEPVGGPTQLGQPCGDRPEEQQGNLPMCGHETGKPSNHAKTISNSHS